MLVPRKAGDSTEETVQVSKRIAITASQGLSSALYASGFRQSHESHDTLYFLACPIGTFSSYSSTGTARCTPCLPGIKYLDKLYTALFFLWFLVALVAQRELEQ